MVPSTYTQFSTFSQCDHTFTLAKQDVNKEFIDILPLKCFNIHAFLQEFVLNPQVLSFLPTLYFGNTCTPYSRFLKSFTSHCNYNTYSTGWYISFKPINLETYILKRINGKISRSIYI